MVDGKPVPAPGDGGVSGVSGVAAHTDDTTEDDGTNVSSDAPVTPTPSPSKKRKVVKAKASTNANADASADANGEPGTKTTEKKGGAKGKGKGKGIVKKMEEMDVDTAVEDDVEEDGPALGKQEDLAAF